LITLSSLRILDKSLLSRALVKSEGLFWEGVSGFADVKSILAMESRVCYLCAGDFVLLQVAKEQEEL